MLGRRSHNRSRKRIHDLLLDERTGWSLDVLPRPRLRHHPPERVRRGGRRLLLDRSGRRNCTGHSDRARNGCRPGTPDSTGHPGQDVRAQHEPAGRRGSYLDLGHRSREWSERQRRSLVQPRLSDQPEPRGFGRLQCIRPLGLRCVVLPAANRSVGRRPRAFRTQHGGHHPMYVRRFSWASAGSYGRQQL